jgi:spore germination protein KB
MQGSESMNNKATISPQQVTLLFLSFITSSAIVFIPNPVIQAAHNGAWLSMLLSGLCGMLMLALVLYLYRQHPSIVFVQYFRDMFGAWFTVLVIVPFLLSLFMMTANITQGLGLFLTSSMMVETPMYIFHAFTLVAAALTVRAGIEVMARMFGLLIFIVIVTVAFVLLFAIPDYDPGALLPQFNDGWKPIAYGTYLTYGWPYSEIFLFTSIFCFVRTDTKKKWTKPLYGALVFHMLVFSIVIACTIMTFGKSAAERKYSLYEVARVIEITGIFERIESIVGITLIAGSYMKISICLFVLNLTASRLFNLKDDRLLIYPISVAILFLSVTMFPTESEAFECWTVVWPFIAICFSVPLLLALTGTVVRNIRRRGQALRKH